MDKQAVQALIERYAPQFNVPVTLATAQQTAEDAPESPTASSPTEAIGLFQIEPATATWLLGLSGVMQKALAIPELNVMLGMFYDGWLKGRLQTLFQGEDLWRAVMAAYNCGLGRVEVAVGKAKDSGLDGTQYGNIQAFLPQESRVYVDKIFAEFAQAMNPEA